MDRWFCCVLLEEKSMRVYSQLVMFDPWCQQAVGRMFVGLWKAAARALH
jgi:hypothetical protein